MAYQPFDYNQFAQFMSQAGGNAYSQRNPMQMQQMPAFQQGGGMVPMQPQQPMQIQQKSNRTITDPLGVNRTPAMGAILNPFGEAVKSKSPQPITDPLGYSMGFYKPGSKLGNTMNKVNDPIGLFKGGFGGLLG